MDKRREVEEWLLKELWMAFLDARKRKRATQDEQSFELNVMENLVQLRDDILNRRYKPSRGVAFVIHDPVVREIFAAPFRDRVVHHFLFRHVADWWDRRFIEDSYSCRVGKGTLYGVKRMQKHILSVSRNNTKPAVMIKMDLQGYFMSLPRKEVYDRVIWGLDRQFADSKMRWLRDLLQYLWAEIIFDDPTEGVRIRGSYEDWLELPENKSLFHQPPGQGIVIGNLSSQLISNIYLDQLDRFVTLELGYKHYGRYVDDFYYVVPMGDLEQAMTDLDKMNDFLIDLKLTLHPKKRYIQDVRRGTPFLGCVVYPTHIVPGRRMKKHFHRAMQRYARGEIGATSVASYLGQLRHIEGRKLTEKYFNEVGLQFLFR